MSNETKSITIEPNKKFEEICLNNLEHFRRLELPIIELGHNYEAVFIEFYSLPHTEVLIRNCIIKLGKNWSHTIICGNDNYVFYKNICKNINRNIKVINIFKTLSTFSEQIQSWDPKNTKMRPLVVKP